MARPKKQTVEYFPHQVAHGKTLFVLEEAYGNDGYAFWFKLLEILGETNGHHIDCRELGVWAHVVSRTNILNSRAGAIIETLANVDAIDQELWEKCRVVWSQNFVDGIRDVYANRESDAPSRPAALLENPISDTQKELFEGYGGPKRGTKGFPALNQRKGKESKPEQSKEAVCSVPEILRGLELYETNEKLLKTFVKNYENWQRAYPYLDVDYEIRKAHSWEIDNPRKQKKNKARFLGGWLSGADERRSKRPDQRGRSREQRIKGMEDSD